MGFCDSREPIKLMFRSLTSVKIKETKGEVTAVHSAGARENAAEGLTVPDILLRRVCQCERKCWGRCYKILVKVKVQFQIQMRAVLTNQRALSAADNADNAR